MENKLLEDKIVLVTGASRGIGLATAMACVSAGGNVVLNYHKNRNEIHPSLNALEKRNDKITVIRADVGSSKEVQKMFADIKNKFGRLDVLVNNAGIRKDSLLINTSERDWDETLRVNLKGTFLCLREAAKLMLASGGRIINITSIVGIYGNPGQAAYGASKAGIIGLTKSAAKELGKIGITVNAIAPGLIDTQMVADLTPKQKTDLIKNIPLGRTGTPEEIASVVLFLASDMATYINGQVIGVDGGMIM